MKLKALISLAILCFILGASLEADAQRKSKYKRKAKSKNISKYKGGSVGGRFRPYHFISFNVNALNYFGDLAPVNRAASTDISFTRPGFGGNIGYKFNSRTAIRAGFNYGRIKGDDFSSDPFGEDSQARYLRNLSFRNDIKELHIGFEFYLNPNWGGPNVRPDMNLYLFIGGAIFHHEPRALVPDLDHTTGGTTPAPQAGEWVKLRPLGTEGQFIEGLDVKTYSPIQLSIPIALGVKIRLPGPFDAGVEFGYRYLFTDYIDDVSSKYVNFTQFDDPLARIMSDRSAEPIAAWEGIQRDNVRIASQTFASDPNTTYYAAGDVGGGLSDGAIRGNPKDNDMIFMTTLKLTMILGQKIKTAAKFR